MLRRGKKKIQSELNGGGFECWTEDFILYVLCNGKTLKTFEWGREKHQVMLCRSSSRVRMSQDGTHPAGGRRRQGCDLCCREEGRGREGPEEYIIALSRNTDSGPGQILSLTCSGFN